MGNYMWGSSGHKGWSGMGLHMAGFGLIWILLLIVAAVLLWRVLGSRRSSHKNIETPVNILKQRYARGEITKSEFESLKHDLDR